MNKKSPKENGVQLPFNETAFTDKWAEWLQYRKERRLATYTVTGIKRTFTKLLEDSGGNVLTAIAIIDQSLALSYQGLFPLKQQYNGHHTTQSIGKTFTPD
jgi:hypothetical protein